jgi:N-acetylmuramoyl-L-alanine amidase
VTEPLRNGSDQDRTVRRFQEARARKRRARRVGTGIAAALFVVFVVVLALALSCGASGDDPPSSASDPGDVPLLTTTTSPLSSITLGDTTSFACASVMPATSSSTSHSAPTSLTVSSSSSSVLSTTTTVGGSSWVVVIDPGHQARGSTDPEPIGPGAAETKPRVSDGTAGVATGIPESELVLAVSLRLRDALIAAGIDVVMTRTTQDVNLSNIQRAQIANQAGADLFVRIHADGANDPAIAGIHVLYPADIKGWTDDIAAPSKYAATLAQRELIVATGAQDRGIDARADMTGFNWSDVPVILPEIGFMTNPDEDRLLATAAYQEAIVAGLTRAITDFLHSR